MERRAIQRQIRVEAPPEVVFAVVSDPAHVERWWPDEADYEPLAGHAGQVVFTHDGQRLPVGFQVVEAIPHRLFSFRWTQAPGEEARPENSLLVTFALEPAGAGTLLRMTEAGYEDRDWEPAVLEETYRDHAEGWDYHLARLAPYVASYVASGAPR